MASSARFLILTASMGEGHNTAARNIRNALLAEGVGEKNILLDDPYNATNPLFNRIIESGYRVAINRYPGAWKLLFNFLSKPGVVEGIGPMLSELRRALKSLIGQFRPDVIVSTYPIFSFLLRRLSRGQGCLPPLFTVITDSTQINAAWYRWLCAGFIVADETTQQTLVADKVPPAIIHVLGFPVCPKFESSQPAPHPGQGLWRAIFFPSGSIRRAVETIQCLDSLSGFSLTVIAGRRAGLVKALQSRGMPKRGELLGWTDRMPELMASHHFFIGKAGGATVQEALAARIPFIVSHVVPGQEEGNIALIERLGVGTLAAGSPSHVADLLRGATANDGTIWRAWRANLEKNWHPGASRRIAQFLLSQARPGALA